MPFLLGRTADWSRGAGEPGGRGARGRGSRELSEGPKIMRRGRMTEVVESPLLRPQCGLPESPLPGESRGIRKRKNDIPDRLADSRKAKICFAVMMSLPTGLARKTISKCHTLVWNICAGGRLGAEGFIHLPNKAVVIVSINFESLIHPPPRVRPIPANLAGN